MIRISISFFYKLGGNLRSLTGVQAGMKLGTVWSTLNTAQTDLQSLFGADWFFHAVKAAYSPGDKLVRAIKALTDRTDWDSDLTFLETFAIHDALKEFETVITNEIANADSYFVTRKAGYDISILISNAERCFPLELGTKVPGAIKDIREAGKCIAFELSTAAGIHALRATEAVLRAYWTAISNGKPHPGNKTMGAYLKKMNALGIGDGKVKAALQQIKDLHRNPLMHPRDTLDLEEAVSIFGVTQSAIQAMLKAIPVPSSVATSSASQ